MRKKPPPTSTPDEPSPLERAIERNAAIEMHCRDKDDQLYVVKTRFLGVSDEGLETDWPTSIGHDFPVTLGMHADVYFIIDDTRYSFRTSIVDVRRKIEVNDHVSVVGVVLAAPDRIGGGQRRNDHRVSVITEMTNVVIHPVHWVEPGILATRVDAVSLPVRVVDLSVNGMATILPFDLHRHAAINDLLFAEFDLDGDGPFSMLYEVRQRRSLERTQDVRVGLQAVLWPERLEFRRRQQRLQRFLVSVERARLRSAS